MASATATATMAAAGFDKRHSTSSSLQTPGSGTFPSEILSPMAGSPGFLKTDELNTPITQPSAYLDFLSKMSPAMMSPALSTGASSRFSFGEKPSARSSEAASDKSMTSPPPTSQPPLSRNVSHDSSTTSTTLPPPLPRNTSHDSNISQPPLSRNTSYDSNASHTSNASTQSAASHASSTGSTRTRPESPRIVIPPSPFAKPAAPRSARTPRRLHIPQSPFSPAGLGSAHSVPSPYSSTPLSAAPWSASFSPREYSATEATDKPGKVSVRQVVTRTVTYCRTPLDPAPKGKRRKIEVEEVNSSKEGSQEPPIKQERIDEDATPSTAQPVEPAVPATEPTKDA